MTQTCPILAATAKSGRDGPRRVPKAFALLPALVLACLLLAGCAGGKGSDGAGGIRSASVTRGGASGPETPISLPAWAVGDFWTYTVNDVPATYVITSETASDWIMETDSAERSFSDLRDDVSRLGPQRKSDLAGSQGTDRVEFFRWPLTTGMDDWTTSWDHEAVRIHVIGANPGFTELEARLVNATAADPPLYKYTYDDTVGWFRELTHYAADGSAIVTLKLTASGHDWTGDLARWDVNTILDEGGSLAQGIERSGTYDVPLTATDVWVHAVLHCTTGVAQAGTSPFPFASGLAGQDARGAGASGQPCPSDEEFTGSAGVPNAPAQGGSSETWGYATAASPDATGTYQLEILVRTLMPVPFGI
jgi:hypothetical protein